jgi:hypothetical protein
LKPWWFSQKNPGRSLPAPMHNMHNDAEVNSTQLPIRQTLTAIRPAQKTSASCIRDGNLSLQKL